MSWRRIAIALLALGALAAGWWIVYGRGPAVSAAEPVRGTAVEIVYATGAVEPVRWAKVSSVIRDRIVDLCYCEGEPVIKGQVLARLDDRELRAQLGELKAREDFLKREMSRVSELMGRGIASTQAYERASTDLRQIQALIAVQTEKLADYEIVAPMEGIVLRRDGEVGEIAEAGQVLFRVGVPKPLQVVAEVNEEDIPRVAIGQLVLLRTDAFPNRRIEGKVREITPMGDAVAKTYRIRVELPDDTPLKPGHERRGERHHAGEAGRAAGSGRRGAGKHRLRRRRRPRAQAGGRSRHPGHAQYRNPFGRRRAGSRDLARAARRARRRPAGARDDARGAVVNLVFGIALTHVRARARQTLVAVAGVATGVGFSIMMAALLQGSQQDFIRQLVNAMPHITVSDERRKPTPQPSETFFDSAEIHGLTPQARRRGIKNPLATMASLEGWVPGAVAPSVKVQAILRYASRDVGASIVGIEPRRESSVSRPAQADAAGHACRALSRHQRDHPRRSPGREDRRARRLQHHRPDERGRAS